MRTLFVAASLLLTALAVVPSASADPACYERLCCSFPDPQGAPGSPGYIVTYAVHSGGHAACKTADGLDPVGTVLYWVDCLVWGYC